MRLAWLLIVAGCYSASPPSGVPCANGPGPRCPGDQVCVTQAGVEVCLHPDQVQPDAAFDASVVDMMIDGSPFLDTDGDTVNDALDNCLAKPNADQANEDGDALGDACDPCPPAVTNTDPDGDGVGGICDPNPNTPGDVLVLFEGFNAPVSWTMVGAWSFAQGAASVTVGSGETAYLVAPTVPDTRGVASAGVRVIAAGAGRPSIGVANPFARQLGTSGIECELFADGDQRRFGLYDIGPASSFESAPLDWAENTTYRVRQQRIGDMFRCSVDNDNEQDNANPVLLQAAIAVRASGVAGSFAWMMYVDSP